MRLFSLCGFEVSIDLSWVLLAVLIAWTLAGSVFPGLSPNQSSATYWVMGVLGAAGLFMSIVLHEMAHSLVARRYGMAIRGITLFIFGGVAEMTAEPERPRAELLMAAAGPTASFALALVFYLLAAGSAAAGAPGPVIAVLSYLALINLVLAVFNLIPAFPLDGGRIFRAALWGWRGDFDWATRIAAGAGSFFGVFLMVLGVVSVLQGNFVGGMWQFLIGLFLRGAASATYGDTLARRLLGKLTVAQVMQSQPITVTPALSVQAFVNDAVYRHHHRWFPVVDSGSVVGSIDTRQLASVDRGAWPETPVSRIMRPLVPDDAVSAEASAFAALGQMRRTERSRLMVIRDRRLLGIVTSRDLLNILSLEQELGGRASRAPEPQAGRAG